MKALETFSISRLSVLEFGQHIKSVCIGIRQLDDVVITDEILLDYLEKIEYQVAEYDQAMKQIVKSDETAKIVAADKARDAAVSATQRLLSVFELSEDQAEREAYASLYTVFKIYKGIQRWNLEEATSGLDNLVSELAVDKYAAHVMTLNMQTYVLRIKRTNDAFKVAFSARMQEMINKKEYDLKSMRSNMKAVYMDMSDYVFLMAKALNEKQYNDPLNVINAVRKYYADLLAKRNPRKKKAVDIGDSFQAQSVSLN